MTGVFGVVTDSKKLDLLIKLMSQTPNALKTGHAKEKAKIFESQLSSLKVSNSFFSIPLRI